MTALPQPQSSPWPTDVRCLLLSAVNVTRLPPRAGQERPAQDFSLLAEALNADIIDTENYQLFDGPLVRIAKHMGRPWAIAAAAVQRLRSYQAVIALSDDVGVPMAALMQIFNAQVPGLIICQHMVSKRPAIVIGRLRMTRAIHKFLCLCPAQERFIRDQYHVPQHKLEVIHYQTDHRFYRPLPEVPVQRQVCSAGMTSRDYRTLLRATRGVDVQVKIEARSAWLTSGLNLAPDEFHERVEICDYGTSVGLRQLYAESQIVVLPLENVPFIAGYSTLLEGMAMGKPVIASRIAMIGEFIKDGQNGLLVRPEDPDDLREKINYLLAHPDEARRMGENARRTIEEQFTLDHYRERLQVAVREAIERDPARGSVRMSHAPKRV